MKILILLVALAAGCTSVPMGSGSLASIQRQCVAEELKSCLNMWSRWEFENWTDISSHDEFRTCNAHAKKVCQ